METIFTKDKHQRLSDLGSAFNLAFSSHMALGDKLIALDGIKKCLLVLETDNQSYIIDLNKISTITVKTTYGNIRSGELKNKRIEEYLHMIELQFEYRNDKGAVCLPFYDSRKDDLRNLPGLERNARNWQMILSKMISRNK